MDVTEPPVPGRTGPAPGGPAPELEDLYDDGVLARIDRSPRPAAGDGSGEETPEADGAPEAGGVPEAGAPVIEAAGRFAGARRFGIAGAVLAGTLMGLGEVLDPEPDRHHIVGYVPDRPDEDTQLVTYHHVPGDPRASRIVVRPWLAGRGSRSGA